MKTFYRGCVATALGSFNNFLPDFSYIVLLTLWKQRVRYHR